MCGQGRKSQDAVAGCEMQVASRKMWVAGCEMWVAGCEMWVAGCEMWVAGCKMRFCESRVAIAKCRGIGGILWHTPMAYPWHTFVTPLS